MKKPSLDGSICKSASAERREEKNLQVRKAINDLRKLRRDIRKRLAEPFDSDYIERSTLVRVDEFIGEYYMDKLARGVLAPETIEMIIENIRDQLELIEDTRNKISSCLDPEK